METEIRKDSYRRSWVFTSLILAGLVGLFGLVYFLVLCAATYGESPKADRAEPVESALLRMASESSVDD